MIHNSFMPHPITTGLPLHTQWFTQDGQNMHHKHTFGLHTWHHGCEIIGHPTLLALTPTTVSFWLP